MSETKHFDFGPFSDNPDLYFYLLALYTLEEQRKTDSAPSLVKSEMHQLMGLKGRLRDFAHLFTLAPNQGAMRFDEMTQYLEDEGYIVCRGPHDRESDAPDGGLFPGAAFDLQPARSDEAQHDESAVYRGSTIAEGISINLNGRMALERIFQRNGGNRLPGFQAAAASATSHNR